MCWYSPPRSLPAESDTQLGQSASMQLHTQPRLSLSDPHVNAGLTWQTRRNRQILLLLLINRTSPARAVRIQQGYAACQICVCKPVCVCVCVSSGQKANMTQLQLFSFSAMLQTAVPQTRCHGSPRGLFI